MDQWIAAATFVATGIGLIWGWSKMWTNLTARVAATETKIEGHDRLHEQHVQHEAEIALLIRGVSQTLTDHVDNDKSTFERIDKYMEETRGDIKSILKAVGGKE